jgi:cytidyltransferase-like protein
MKTSETQCVMVSGCFDLLHSGHIAFLEQASAYGQLHVAIGSDRTVRDLKGRPPITSEQERLYMMRSLKCVHDAFISTGSGVMDFLPELQRLRPDIFFLNKDGDTPSKRQAVEAEGVRYVVAERIPQQNMAPRSSTALRQLHTVPYRVDLAGGWLDQPFVSKYHPGAVVNCSLEPREEYELRSGMSSSTRQTAIGLWGPRLPFDDREKLARIIFACENPPGTTNVAGSQDAIGIVYPGLNRLMYRGDYWPESIETVMDSSVLDFIESHVQLVFSGPRPPGFDVLAKTHIDAAGALALARASDECWEAILKMDAAGFGRAVTASFDAQVAMFPRMLSPEIRQIIDSHRGSTLGHKITGAGGGGYVVLVTQRPIQGAIGIKIRREH